MPAPARRRRNKPAGPGGGGQAGGGQRAIGHADVIEKPAALCTPAGEASAIERLDVLDPVDAAKAAMRAGHREFLGDALGSFELDGLAASLAHDAIAWTVCDHREELESEIIPKGHYSTIACRRSYLWSVNPLVDWIATARGTFTA